MDSYLGTIPWNPTHFCWEKDTAKSWGQTDVADAVPALRGFMFFMERHSVSLRITLLKRVIINHDTKYQGPRTGNHGAHSAVRAGLGRDVLKEPSLTGSQWKVSRSGSFDFEAEGTPISIYLPWMID